MRVRVRQLAGQATLATIAVASPFHLRVPPSLPTGTKHATEGHR